MRQLGDSVSAAGICKWDLADKKHFVVAVILRRTCHTMGRTHGPQCEKRGGSKQDEQGDCGVRASGVCGCAGAGSMFMFMFMFMFMGVCEGV